jgi:hypothetical protein
MRLDMDAGPNAPPNDHPLVAGENATADPPTSLGSDCELATDAGPRCATRRLPANYELGDAEGQIAPSHGENRGSSPLGSANYFNKLLANKLPAYRGLGRFWGLNVDGRQRLITYQSQRQPTAIHPLAIQHANIRPAPGGQFDACVINPVALIQTIASVIAGARLRGRLPCRDLQGDGPVAA